MKDFWISKISSHIDELDKNWLKEIYDTANSNYLNSKIEFDKSKNEVFLKFFKINFKTYVNRNLIILFEYLNRSIIVGEPFKNGFKTEIDKVIIDSHLLLNVVDFDDSFDDDLILTITDYVINHNPFKLLKDCLIEYRSSSNYLIRQFKNPSLHTLFDISDNTDNLLKELKNETQKNLLKLTKGNLDLLRKDFSLKYNIIELQNLLLIKNRLNEPRSFFENGTNLDVISNILIEKCVFLIRKLVIRKSTEKNVLNENYVFLGNEIEFNLDSHILNLDTFKDYDAYSQNHFLCDENREKRLVLIKNAEKIILEEKTKHTAKEIHTIVKYYKDLDENNYKLEQIDKLTTLSDNDFDKYAINIKRNYITNNIFSEKLKHLPNESLIEAIKDHLEEINLIQQKTSINNFFPYFKACLYLNKYIDNELKLINKNNIKLEKIKELEDVLKYFKKVYNVYVDNLKWSKIHLNYAYQLPYNESITKHKEIEVFTSSSFSLPIDYLIYDNLIEKLKSYIPQTENTIKNFYNINSLIKVYDEEKNKLQGTISKNLKSNIEILGIFSAIITISFSAISISAAKINFKEKFFVFISLFSILFLFIILLKSYNKPEEKSTFNIVWLFIGFMILLMSIMTIMYNYIIVQ
ncbi:hypothetical protein [Tenacibaculum bernardetii]|uniref:hypothetical protein n=1 Tax=Tenacibaculum bernardetii TaxID=3021375 RepID=UPI0023B1F443|nr:hypothetical protein [Tenacibaculum bernardetii]